MVMQAGNANYLQKALANQAGNFQVIEEDAGQVRVENVVQLGPFLAIKAGGSCTPQGANRTLVQLDDIRAELGPFRFAINTVRILHCFLRLSMILLAGNCLKVLLVIGNLRSICMMTARLSLMPTPD